MKIHRSTSITFPHFPKGSERSALFFIGFPWKKVGRDVSGIDCLGLVVLWFRSCGLDVVDPVTAIEMEARKAGFADKFVRIYQPDFGDVLLDDSDDNLHLGILTFDGILESKRRTGCCISPLPSDQSGKWFRHKTIVDRINSQ